MGKAKKSRLCALALAGLSLFSAPKMEADSFLGIGLSAPCHGLLAARGVYDFNNSLGIQADLGIGFSGVDLRYKVKTMLPNSYVYAGAVGISPWIYLMTPNATATGATFMVEAGVGFELPSWNGFSLGLEGGLGIPIPPDPNTQFFRIDANVMYHFPGK